MLFFRTPTGGAPGEISATGPLPVYDRQGRKVADLAQRLPELLGGGAYEILEMTVDGTVFIAPHSFEHRPPRPLAGQARQHTRTQVVLKVRPGGGGPERRVLGLDAAGAATFDLTVDGRWGKLLLSPRGRYLRGESHTGGVILDAETGQTIAEDPFLGEGAFAPDDSIFAFLEADGGRPAVTLLSLSTGGARSIPLPAQLAFDLRDLTIAAAIDRGFVFQSLRCTYSACCSRLWLLSHAGEWVSFHRDPDADAFESLVGLAEDGRRVLFSRATHCGTSQQAPGYYRFDPAAAIDRRVESLIVNAPPFTPSDGDTLAAHYAPGRMLFIDPTAVLNRLVAWPLGSTAPEVLGPIGPLPADGEPWSWQIQRTSDDGTIIAVGLSLWSAKFPETVPEEGMIVVDDQGDHLLSLPWGTGALDRTGTLFVHQPSRAGSTRERFVIADIAGRSESRLDIEELSFALIYGTRASPE